MAERRIDQLRRAGEVLVPGFSKHNSLAFSITIADPQMRTLLLVQIIDHDLMLDIFEERAPSATDGSVVCILSKR